MTYARPEFVEGGSGLIEAVLKRVHDELGGLVHAERVHDVRAVYRDRVGADAQPGRDIAVRKAFTNQLQHLELACRQPISLAGQRRRPYDGRVEHRFSGRDPLDGRRKIQVDDVLEDVAACSGVHGLPNQRLFGMHAEHQDCDPGSRGEDGARRGQSARAGHCGIHHDHARPELGGEPDRVVAIGGFADHFDVRIVLEHASKPSTHEVMIVGEEDSNPESHAAVRPAMGTLSRTSVPPCGGCRNSRVPPRRAARSRMATSPSPRRETSATIPRP